MVSAEFHHDFAYALSCIDGQDLTLTVKAKQEEALVVVVHLQLSHGTCLLDSLLATGSRSTICCWPSCITSKAVRILTQHTHIHW